MSTPTEEAQEQKMASEASKALAYEKYALDAKEHGQLLAAEELHAKAQKEAEAALKDGKATGEKDPAALLEASHKFDGASQYQGQEGKANLAKDLQEIASNTSSDPAYNERIKNQEQVTNAKDSREVADFLRKDGEAHARDAQQLEAKAESFEKRPDPNQPNQAATERMAAQGETAEAKYLLSQAVMKDPSEAIIIERDAKAAEAKAHPQAHADHLAHKDNPEPAKTEPAATTEAKADPHPTQTKGEVMSEKLPIDPAKEAEILAQVIKGSNTTDLLHEIATKIKEQIPEASGPIAAIDKAVEGLGKGPTGDQPMSERLPIDTTRDFAALMEKNGGGDLLASLQATMGGSKPVDVNHDRTAIEQSVAELKPVAVKDLQELSTQAKEHVPEILADGKAALQEAANIAASVGGGARQQAQGMGGVAG